MDTRETQLPGSNGARPGFPTRPITGDFPPDMPIPAKISAIEGVSFRDPTDAYRPGVISGTDEENAENLKSSESDIASDDELPPRGSGI